MNEPCLEMFLLGDLIHCALLDLEFSRVGGGTWVNFCWLSAVGLLEQFLQSQLSYCLFKHLQQREIQ